MPARQARTIASKRFQLDLSVTKYSYKLSNWLNRIGYLDGVLMQVLLRLGDMVRKYVRLLFELDSAFDMSPVNVPENPMHSKHLPTQIPSVINPSSRGHHSHLKASEPTISNQYWPRPT